MGTLTKRNIVQWGYLSIRKLPPSSIGIYGFWNRNNGRCIYIGQAKDRSIKDRVHDHWRQSHNSHLSLWIRAYPKILDICYVEAAFDQVDRLEQLLIGRLRPEANIKLNHKKWRKN